MNNHSCIKITPRQTDYIKGVNSPIAFKAISSGDWTPRIEFFEDQKIGFETNGCVLFTAQEDFDAQMDQIILNGVPDYFLSWLNANGYMDTGLDGKSHFHSSSRFLQVLTGNAFEGNSLPDPWDAMRKFGVLPWKDLPYDASVPQDHYLDPIPQPLLTKAAQFLSLIGGKNAIQYHWILNAAQPHTPDLLSALPQAPISLGINLSADTWNQLQPPNVDGAPVHSVMNYLVDSYIEIYDHYHPEKKELSLSYPIHYALQGIVAPNFAPPALPQNPTTPQISSWLTQVSAWLSSLLIALKGRTLTSAHMNYSLFRSRTFYTILAQAAYNIWQLLVPSVSPDISAVLNVVFFSLASYFHLETGQSPTGTN